MIDFMECDILDCTLVLYKVVGMLERYYIAFVCACGILYINKRFYSFVVVLEYGNQCSFFF